MLSCNFLLDFWIVVQVPDTQHALSVPGHGFSYGGRGPGRIVSPGEVRPSQLTGNLSRSLFNLFMTDTPGESVYFLITFLLSLKEDIKVDFLAWTCRMVRLHFL